MYICNDDLQRFCSICRRIYGITVVKLSIISIFAPFRPLFNPLEVLGYPSNEYVSFYTVQVYLYWRYVTILFNLQGIYGITASAMADK